MSAPVIRAAAVERLLCQEGFSQSRAQELAETLMTAGRANRLQSVGLDPVTGAMVGESGQALMTPDGRPGTTPMYTVGAFYFPGWSTPGGGPNPANPWAVIPANRMPVDGPYDETQQAVVDRNLERMRNAGIGFVNVFAYWQGSATNPQPFLDHFIRRYLTSRVPNKPKLCLCLEVMTNSTVFNTSSLPLVIEQIRPYLRDPNYLRIDGKPVISFFDASSFDSRFGGGATAIAALAGIRTQLAAEFGPIIVMAVNSDSSNFWMGKVPAMGFDGVTAYTTFFKWSVGGDVSGTSKTGYDRVQDACYGPNEVISSTNYHSWWGHSGYADSAPGAALPFPAPALTNNGWANTSLQYLWAPIQTGWDSRPWDAGNTLLGIATPAEFRAHCLQARQACDANRSKTRGFLIVTAWNEYGEGQILDATVATGNAKMRIINEVFGN